MVYLFLQELNIDPTEVENLLVSCILDRLDFTIKSSSPFSPVLLVIIEREGERERV